MGQSYVDNTSYIQRAFIYSDGIMTDLNSVITPGSGWTLNWATAINNAGQITGEGTINGQLHAFLLEPVGAVPEPATFGLIGSAMFALYSVSIRRLHGKQKFRTALRSTYC